MADSNAVIKILKDTIGDLAFQLAVVQTELAELRQELVDANAEEVTL